MWLQKELAIIMTAAHTYLTINTNELSRIWFQINMHQFRLHVSLKLM